MKPNFKVLWSFLKKIKSRLRKIQHPTYEPKLYPDDYIFNDLGDPFQSNLWLSDQQTSLVQPLVLSEPYPPHIALLKSSLILASACHESNQHLAICDLGGGSGKLFKIIQFIANDLGLNISYTLVDSDSNIKIAQSFFDSQIKCSTYNFDQWTNVSDKYDLIVCAASFQYTDYWKSSAEVISKRASHAVCFLLQPIAINALIPAKVIQNVYIKGPKYCGKAPLTLLDNGSLSYLMKANGFHESLKFQTLPEKNYFSNGCENSVYERVCIFNYLWLRL